MRYLRCIPLLALLVTNPVAAQLAPDPWQSQIQQHVARLASDKAAVRQRAAESLGYLRAWPAAGELARALADEEPAVRREAAMSLGWCGGRSQFPALLSALEDADWTVRRCAAIGLGNLTGIDLPFDAMALAEVRQAQARAWRSAIAALPADRAPASLLDLLKGDLQTDLAQGCKVTASTTYKGPPSAVTDRDASTFWQTKAVKYPQHCTIDLGQPTRFMRIVVQQYGPGYCMTEYGVAISDDGETFKEVQHQATAPQPMLTIVLEPVTTRFLRITSYAGQHATFPTTIREIEVFPTGTSRAAEVTAWARERAIRAIGILGGPDAAAVIADSIRRYAKAGATDAGQKAIVQAGLRALGRLRAAEQLPLLIEFLQNPNWARYAAEAMGDLGDPRAIAALVAVYPQYARDAAGKPPKVVPVDDRPGLEPADRMYEIPYAIAMAVSRLPIDDPADRKLIADIAPLLLVNLPADFDGAMFYEPEASKAIATFILDRIGLLQAARQATFRAVGRTVAGEDPATPLFMDVASRKVGTTVHAASWLPVLCLDRSSAPALIALLEHEDGWVRINAAKALMFLNHREAIEPIARILAASKRESDWGFNGRFFFDKPTQGIDEYNDPTPRWREAFARALGRLGAAEHAPLLVKLLNDEANALEIQHASAVALDELGSGPAVDALRQAALSHPFHSVRLVAREALWRRGVAMPTNPAKPARQATAGAGASAATGSAALEGIVFIKGDRTMPNRFQIDPWRQTYSTTDSGPTYRLGRNLNVLRPATPEGKASPLTHFEDGFVADCEVSWDGKKVIFARRGGDADPWWHVWEVFADGSNLRQLTRGPYHDVQPAYLPDGRIIFSSSRIGLRDEYHGYYATGLTIMNPDGSDLHCVGFNLGRDNEPAILADGRIVFSRLELFYSRLKTELVLQAAYPDGTRNVTLYGPERRDLWRDVTRRSGERWWGEVPPRHRVLRTTQPQSLGGDEILCASTGGLVIVGPSRTRETFVPHDPAFAVTTPFPLDDHRFLCAAALKSKDPVKDPDTQAIPGDLGIYTIDRPTGKLEPLYNDPQTADFEPRPLRARRPPPMLPESPEALGNGYTARFMCASATNSQDQAVRDRGRFVRVIEGTPIVGRHATHNSPGVNAWKNHTGTIARILGTLPLAGDGSFFVEVPADRLIHMQVLDADRRVVGNQLIWMYARPGETRSCAGCHENPESSPLASVPSPVAAAAQKPVPLLPIGGEFTYRAKLWNKGILTDEAEERTRTVRAINLIGRQ